MLQSMDSDAPFELIETMLFRRRIRFLDDHLARLSDSARHFGFPLDEEMVVKAIEEALNPIYRETPQRVRLTLARSGKLSVKTGQLAPESPGRRVAVSAHRIDAGNAFQYHKTTRRELYEREYETAASAGFFDVLFLNERGVLAEASRNNVFVRLDRRIVTPPVSSGLLPGIYRARVLQRCADIVETELFASDLQRASAIYLCNAVRGLRKVHL